LDSRYPALISLPALSGGVQPPSSPEELLVQTLASTTPHLILFIYAYLVFNAIPIPPIPLKALSTTFSTNLLLPWVISLSLQSTSLYIRLNSYVEPIFTCGCNYNQPSSTIYRLLPSGHILAVLSWSLHGRCQPEPSYYIFFSASTSSISHNGQSDWLCKRLGNCWSEIFRRERIYKVFFVR
jgi:hypothetical protein